MERNIEQAVFRVKGMTCVSCEERIRAAVGRLPGVIAVRASQADGRVAVDFEPLTVGRAALAAAIAGAGYEVADRPAPGTSRMAEIGTVAGLGAGLIALFLAANAAGLFNFLPSIDSGLSLGMVFVAGLLTSLHCVAMCGGIALSQQAGRAGPPADAPVRRFARLRQQGGGFRYHLGRVAAYTAIGAAVGGIGSVISLSPGGKGVLLAFAGLFMVVLGLKMLGWLPILARVRIRLPRLLGARPIAALRGRGPFFVGLLNGLMPCGPLQTMQLYALGTGSVLLGAASMFLFSLGTVPLLFAFGALTSFFSRQWQQRLIRVSALLVVFFGLLMAGRALAVSGATGALHNLMAGGGAAAATGAAGVEVADARGGSELQVAAGGQAAGGRSAGDRSVAVISDGVQQVSFDLKPSAYAPITVQKGIPVRWTVNAAADALNGCNGEIVVPALGLRKKLKVGANLIEFTPQSSGEITYTCWMGMITSSITVVDRLDGTGAPAAPAGPAAGADAAGADAAGCCGAGAAPGGGPVSIPAGRIGLASLKTEQGQKIQEVTVTVDRQGYSPAVLVLQRGLPARIRFDARQLDGCNRLVDFPAYQGRLNLQAGQTETPLIRVSQDFGFQCGMGMLHGFVRVVDDLAKVDEAQVRAVAAAWKPSADAATAPGPAAGGCCGSK